MSQDSVNRGLSYRVFESVLHGSNGNSPYNQLTEKERNNRIKIKYALKDEFVTEAMGVGM